MTVLWEPGGRHGVVWPGGVALLDGSLTRETVDSIWRRIEEVDGLQSFILLLGEECGQMAFDLPPFAVVLASSPLHVAARGIPVSVTSDGATQELTGEGHSLWDELRVEFPSGLQLGTPIDSTRGLPLVAGIVPTDGLVWGEGSDGTQDQDTATGAERALDPLATSITATPPSTEEAAPVVEDVPAPQEESPAAPEPSIDEDPPAAGPVEAQPQEPEPEPQHAIESVGNAETLIELDDPEAISSEPDPEPTPPEPVGRFAALYGDTILRPVEDAALRLGDEDEDGPATPAPAAPAPSHAPAPPAQPTPAVPTPPASPLPPTVSLTDPSRVGDHDGSTVYTGPTQTPAYTTDPRLTPDTILGVRCPQGHGNPPHRLKCRVCDAPLTGAPDLITRPGLGWLRLASGERIELTRTIIIGRDPRAVRVTGSLPVLVPIPNQHISASHVEIRVEGWSILAFDLHSRNGTFLRREGEPIMRLPEQPVLLTSGDVLDLSHGVLLGFEELP